MCFFQCLSQVLQSNGLHKAKIKCGALVSVSLIELLKYISFEWNYNDFINLFCPFSNIMSGGAWWAAVHGVAKSGTRLSDFIFNFHALKKEMATHSSVLARRIPGMGKPGGLPSMGSHRVRHDWSNLVAVAAAAAYTITSVVSLSFILITIEIKSNDLL